MIQNALFKLDTKESNCTTPNLLLFKPFSENLNITRNESIFRTLIVYFGYVVIVTSNSNEVEKLVMYLNEALNLYGLQLINTKTKLVKYDISNPDIKIKFDFLGFTFIYIPCNNIRKGGLLRKNGYLFGKKHNFLYGTHLIYPSDFSYKLIKTKIKILINKLQRLSVFDVINKVNSLIRGWVLYYGWSMSLTRLLGLDYYVFKRFKSKLIQKFRKRGLYRVRWVLQKYMVCATKTNSELHQPLSPYGLKWHLHSEYPKAFNFSCQVKHFLFLTLASRI
jgi:hypothetical protein